MIHFGLIECMKLQCCENGNNYVSREQDLKHYCIHRTLNILVQRICLILDIMNLGLGIHTILTLYLLDI